MPDPFKKYPGLAKIESQAKPNWLNEYLTISNPNEGRVKKAKQRTKERAGGPSDIDILQGMLGGMGMGPSSVDIERMKAQALRAISAQFDPMIRGVKTSMDKAKKRAGGAKKEIGSIYDSLTDYYEDQVAPTKARSAEYKAGAKSAGEALKSAITDDYATRLREQVDQYKQLGIEASIPSSSSQQLADQANALAMAENTAAAEMSALNLEEVADVGYWTEGAGIARTEGAEQQTEITKALQRYLDEQEAQLQQVKGQKEAAYQQAILQLEQEAAQQAQQQQNQLWNRMLDLARLKQAASSGGSNRGLTGALSYLNDQRLGNFFQSALSAATIWGNSAQARSYYGGQPPNTPEEWAQVIRDHAANQRLSARDQSLLYQAALRYYGRG